MTEEKKGDNEFVHASYFNVTLKDLEKKVTYVCFGYLKFHLRRNCVLYQVKGH